MALAPKKVDFSYVDNALDAQEMLRKDRANRQLQNAKKQIALTESANKKTLAVQEQQRQSNQQTRQAQLDIMGSMDSTIAKAKEAIALSDSDNPMDRLKLWAYQQTDPSGYTRQGNTERLQYLQNAANALGNRELIVQAGYMDQTQEIQDELTESMLGDNADLELLKAQEANGAEAIDAATQAQAVRAQFMTNTATMQDQALASMTPDQVKTATMAASQAPDSQVNIGGVNISAGKLIERQAALDDREYYTAVHQTERQNVLVGNLTAEDTERYITEAAGSKDGMALIKGVQVPVAQLHARKAALQSRDYNQAIEQQTLANIAESNLNKTLTRQAGTYSLPELNSMIANGNVDPATGTYFPQEILESARNAKATARDQLIQDQVTMAQAADPMSATVEQKNYLDSIQTQHGTPLEGVVNSSKTVLNAAAALAASGQPDTIRASQAILLANRENVDKAISAEAQRLSPNDKTLALAHEYQLRGQPIPQHIIIEGLTERMSKPSGGGVGSWLTPAMAGLYESTYRGAMQEMQLKPTLGMDKETMKRDANQIALSAVLNQVGGELSNNLMVYQFSDQKNPLVVAGVKPEVFMNIVRTADVEGARLYKNASGKKDEEIAALMSGQITDPDFSASQASQLYLALEKTKPGLGQEYLDWWTSPAQQEMTRRYGQAVTQQAQDNFMKLSENSLIVADLTDMTQTYANQLADGQKFLYANDLNRQHTEYVTFGGNAANKQAFLLQSDTALNDLERQQAYALLIQPLVIQTEALKMPANQAATYIEQNLRSMRPDDPVAKKLLTKVLAGREASLKVVDNFAVANSISPGSNYQQWGAVYDASQNSSNTNTYGWFKELTGEKK